MGKGPRRIEHSCTGGSAGVFGRDCFSVRNSKEAQYMPYCLCLGFVLFVKFGGVLTFSLCLR